MDKRFGRKDKSGDTPIVIEDVPTIKAEVPKVDVDGLVRDAVLKARAISAFDRCTVFLGGGRGEVEISLNKREVYLPSGETYKIPAELVI